MRTSMVTLLTCAVLALVIGAASWAAWPTGRSYSFITESHNDYVLDAGNSDASVSSKKFMSVTQTVKMADGIKNIVGDNAFVYSVPFAEGGTLKFGTKEIKSATGVPAYGEYVAARNLSLLAGRWPKSDSGEVALGFAAAKRLADKPETLIGKTVLYGAFDDPFHVVGVVRASEGQDDNQDPDAGFVRFFDPQVKTKDELFELNKKNLPLRITVSFKKQPSPVMLRSLNSFVRRTLPGYEFKDLQAGQQKDLGNVIERVRGRGQTLTLFAAALAIAGLCTLFAYTLSGLLRRRALMGVDKALGASRTRLLRALLVGQLVPAALGAALGTAALMGLPSLAKDVFVGSLPLGVGAIAFLLPTLSLLLLTATLGGGALRESSYAMLRGATPGQHLGTLLALMGLGLSLALGGAFTALGVRQHVNGQVRLLESNFAPLWALETGGAGADKRRGFDLGFSAPLLQTRDADALSRVPGVQVAAVAQRINGRLRHGDKSAFTFKAIATDPRYFKLLNLPPLVVGNTTGCVSSAALKRTLGANLGDEISIQGVDRVVRCKLTGVLAPANPLYTWLIVDYPQFVAPPLPGLGTEMRNASGKVAYDTSVFRSERVLLKLAPGVTSAEVRLAFLERRPELRGKFQITPYAPDAKTLLGALRVQAQLFLALAALACALCLYGVVTGFLAVLDASRFRLAVERSYGLTVRALRRRWAGFGMLLGAVVGGAGLAIASAFTPALYNAFSLDAPAAIPGEILPAARVILPDVATLLAVGAVVLVLAVGLVMVGTGWLRRQSLLGLLKEGT